ncbi:hypothetical protein [Shimia aestuarii]|uniref:Uncharacterized protein n=1 Tax=Shimia aestuarii TaxID=254406 RepID=A0A1I4I7N5_9RHOB|nr:hypothetical protein [Shimia aestuarii]SFL50294.1 hypothetical protein SAMN04488042_101469 [Shimia aestuarii]
MSAPVCNSKLQCQRNGLAGTAAFLSAVILGWAGYDVYGAGLSLSAAAMFVTLLAPVWLSVGYVAVMRWQARAVGWVGLAIAAGGTAWGVFVLNGVTRL